MVRAEGVIAVVGVDNGSMQSVERGFPDFQVGRYTTADGVDIAYRVAGSGPAVVLVHGFPQTGYEWRAVAPVMAQQYRVIVPDCRGAGGSAKPDGGYDKSTMARDVHGLLEHLGVDQAHVVGHDIGMMVAFAFARQFPDVTTTLTMMDAVVPGTPTFRALVASGGAWHFGLHKHVDLAVALVRGRERLYFDHFFDTFMVDGTSISSVDRDFYVECMRAPGALEAGIKGYAAFPEDGVENEAWLAGGSRLDMPVLVLGGAASLGPLAQTVGDEVASRVSAVVVPDAGHFVTEEAPVAVAEALVAFWQGTEVGSGEPDKDGPGLVRSLDTIG